MSIRETAEELNISPIPSKLAEKGKSEPSGAVRSLPGGKIDQNGQQKALYQKRYSLRDGSEPEKYSLCGKGFACSGNCFPTIEKRLFQFILIFLNKKGFLSLSPGKAVR